MNMLKLSIMVKKSLLLLAFVFIFFPIYSQLVGKVIAIADGDTFTMLVDKTSVKIRLHGIDCPEKAQDFGNVAKQYLSDLIFGKTVSVVNMDTDRYGRTIGMVSIDSVNVNEALLKAGLAWHYTYYDKNPLWAIMEVTARKEQKGLWAMAEPVAPWEFRRKK